MKAMTWFSVRDVREIKPLPLPRLRKLNDNYPLSSKFEGVRAVPLSERRDQDVSVSEKSNNCGWFVPLGDLALDLPGVPVPTRRATTTS